MRKRSCSMFHKLLKVRKKIFTYGIACIYSFAYLKGNNRPVLFINSSGLLETGNV